jgi:hypothetical protein
MTHQAIVDGLTALVFARPGILAGDDPGDILGDIVDEGRSAAIG